MTLEIFRAAQAAQVTEAIVDVRELGGRLALMDGHLVVNVVFETLREEGLRKAAVVDEKTPPLGSRFVETIAANRGFNFRVFDDRDETLKWLAA